MSLPVLRRLPRARITVWYLSVSVFHVMGGASGLFFSRLLLSRVASSCSPGYGACGVADTPEHHLNQHFLFIYSGSIIHCPIVKQSNYVSSVPMYLCSCIHDYQVLTLCSCPGRLSYAALFLHTAFLVPTPTRLASCINQPLLIAIK